MILAWQYPTLLSANSQNLPLQPEKVMIARAKAAPGLVQGNRAGAKAGRATRATLSCTFITDPRPVSTKCRDTVWLNSKLAFGLYDRSMMLATVQIARKWRRGLLPRSNEHMLVSVSASAVPFLSDDISLWSWGHTDLLHRPLSNIEPCNVLFQMRTWGQ